MQETSDDRHVRRAFENLANAIVVQAAEDYRQALWGMARHKEDRDFFKYSATAKECERFFRSPWYKTLTDVDPEILIGALREECSRCKPTRRYVTAHRNWREELL